MDTFTVGVADADVPTRALLFHMQLSPFEADEIAAGWATYSITDELGGVVYGGVTECVLADGRRALKFNAEAQQALGVGEECIYDLEVDDRSLEHLKAGLARVLQAGLNGLGRPGRLVLGT